MTTHPKEQLTRSLGRIAYWWLRNFVVYGDGAVFKQPIRFGPERLGELMHMYALDEKGKRLYNHVFLSKPKGADKSGFAAYVGCFEVAGPARFAGWAKGGETFEYLGKRYTYRPGEPMGRLINQPRVRCLATEEGQTGLIYDTILTNFKDGPLAELNAATFGGYIELPMLNGGRVDPTTSGASSKDGGRDTLVLADEALALSTVVPTPTGYRHLGDIAVGDEVFGSDGRPVRVVKTTEIMEERRCFRVRFADGTDVVASEGHLWASSVAGGPVRVRTTAQLAAYTSSVSVPRVSGPLQWRGGDELPLDPWLLGYWLGDGDSRAGRVVVGDQDAEAFHRSLPFGWTAVRHDRLGAAWADFNVHAPGYRPGHRGGGLQARLRPLGVLGNKHVPAAYLGASLTDRGMLLRGLMDSDGSARPCGLCEFSNSNPRLLDAVTTLLRSIGERTSGAKWYANERSRTGRTGKVHWTPRLVNPFSYSRKANRAEAGLARPAGRVRVVSIEEVPSVPVRCIAVDSPDHLFVVGDGCVLTHNTHLWFTPALKRAFHTVSRNLTKRPTEEPWLFETTTMYKPGQASIAEETYEVSKLADEGRLRRDSRLLFIHRWGEIKEEEIADEAKLRVALVDAEGDAAEWLDQDRIMDDVYDPANDVNESIRYYLNALAGSAASWLTPAQINAAVTSTKLEKGDTIALGFDGSLTNDSTALVAVRLEDNLVQLLHIQEAPTDTTQKTWSVDQDLVDKVVAKVFEDFDVRAFFADPPYWQDRIERWEAKYGDGLAPSTRAHPIMWWTNKHMQMANAVEAAHTMITTGEVRISENSALVRHLNNACRGGKNDELIYKESRMSRHKIDAAVTTVIALRAAAAARAWTPRETRPAKDPNHGLVSSVPLDMLVPKGVFK